MAIRHHNNKTAFSMKNSIPIKHLQNSVTLVLFFLFSQNVFSQPYTLFVSKQTGKASTYNGNYAKQTDKYEQGNVDLATSGPIQYQVTPGALAISPEQNKNWNGTLTADVNAAPIPGSSAAASILATYDLKYSRPYGSGTAGSVVSTYYCSNSGSASGNGGCAAHNNQPGAHEIVHATGQKTIDFNVVSIKVELPDTICLGTTGQRDITAVAFPMNAGSFVWSSSSNAVRITNGNQATANITLLDTTVKNAVVKVTFSVGDVVYEANGVLSTCECNCKTVTTGINAGPIHIDLNVDPDSPSPNGNGNCLYTANNAAVTINMDGIIKRTVKLENNVKVSFGKGCQSGDLTDVKVDWQGSIDIPALEIKGVKTFELKVKEVHLGVSNEGNLSGTVKVNVSNQEDRDLSLGKKFVMLRKGTNTDVTFTYDNANSWNGSFDFSGIHGIDIDLVKPNDGNDVTIANFKGDMDKDGLLKGDFKVLAQASYKTNLFKITMKELTLGTELKVQDGSFRLTSGSGKIEVSDIKAITGNIELGLNFPEAGGCVATVAANNLSAFTMTLDEFVLQADFNKDFDLVNIEGSLKARHNKFDVKLAVDKFKLENGEIKEFSCSGKVAYSGFSFTLEKASYVPTKITIDAKMEMSATGAAAMVEVKGFTVDENGTITVGTIKGKLDKAPASISFEATFGDNSFDGSFSGDFAGIGMDGTVALGSKENPKYNYAYLSITAKVNVPLGQSGLKLTQIGGKVGYNYSLQGVNGPGEPQQGNYIVGLKVGVADVGNMCEVTGETMIQFSSSSVSITLAGTVAVLKNNKFFDANGNVTYKIPEQTIKGSLGAIINIPANGWVFKSKNLNINFDFGDNKFSANGANMGGDMFGGKLTLSDGNFSLSGDLGNPSSLSGSLGGKAAASFSYGMSKSAAGNTISGNVSFNINANIAASFNQEGLSGNFGVHADGSGTMTVDTWIWTQTISASAVADGTIGYSNSSLSLSGNVTVTLPFSIPFWGNQVSTGNIGITL